MSTPKDLFHAEKELTAKWLAIANEAWFEKVLVYARAHLIDMGATTEDLKGAQKLIMALDDLAKGDGSSMPIPGPGLYNDPFQAAEDRAKELQQTQEKPKRRR